MDPGSCSSISPWIIEGKCKWSTPQEHLVWEIVLVVDTNRHRNVENSRPVPFHARPPLLNPHYTFRYFIQSSTRTQKNNRNNSRHITSHISHHPIPSHQTNSKKLNKIDITMMKLNWGWWKRQESIVNFLLIIQIPTLMHMHPVLGSKRIKIICIIIIH